jgi:hypothetical protein
MRSTTKRARRRALTTIRTALQVCHPLRNLNSSHLHMSHEQRALTEPLRLWTTSLLHLTQLKLALMSPSLRSLRTHRSIHFADTSCLQPKPPRRRSERPQTPPPAQCQTTSR